VALGAFRLRQMTAARAGPQYFAGGGNFKPLRHRLLRFDAFRTSHKSKLIAKEREI